MEAESICSVLTTRAPSHAYSQRPLLKANPMVLVLLEILPLTSGCSSELVSIFPVPESLSFGWLLPLRLYHSAVWPNFDEMEFHATCAYELHI